MSGRFFVPEETIVSQSKAANPGDSVWVAANAGSGKTHVLSRRVIRLLLNGVHPSRILCLTYTRAAAANMVNRVFEDLGPWAMMSDRELTGEIAKLEGSAPSKDRLARARKLFAGALETPGGLKIQTIHAFCESVLRQFPLEANIAGHFELLDGQMEQELIAEARRDLLTGAGIGVSDVLSGAFTLVLSTAGEHGLGELLSEIVSNRDGLRVFLGKMAGAGDRLEWLKREFGFDPAETPDAMVDAIWPDDYFGVQFASGFLSRAETAGKAKASEFAGGLRSACDISDRGLRFEALCGAFLRIEKGAWKARSLHGIASRGVGEHFPGFVDEFERFANILLGARDRVTLLKSIDATNAALTIADFLLTRYEHLKNARGFLDFSDLISRTANLLARQNAGAWVQYKLDRGLDHILIDEAQDTSPGQWQVITSLAEEFYSGLSSRPETHRTVFAVGDEKQSIYSFQGAEPAAFAETGRAFAAKIKGVRGRFSEVRLHHSFRSVGDVLSAVDLVFEPEHARDGLTLYPEPIEHAPIRANDPGYVEIWPMIAAAKSAEPENWTEAIDHASQPAVKLAGAICNRICDWLEKGERIEGTGAKLTPGDIMVLVRKRDAFVHALSRALKDKDIAVAGADRLQLRDHIAVKDLAAIGRFSLQENDDLSLAALLKSPVFNLSEEELFDLAHNRGPGISLWRGLRKAASDNSHLTPVVDRLSKWRSEAGLKPVVEFYSAILGRDGVRSAMIARLGREAGEILDEFINFTFACEQTGITGLGAFLETLEVAGPEIKREVAHGRGEVRIMTVHAAKGLEAPVVFLVDNGSAPFSVAHLPRLMRFALRDQKSGEGYIWRAGSELKSSFTGKLENIEREKAEQEYRRLLYVGMTRAEDRLLVCGYHGIREPKDGTWHRLVSEALVPVSDEIDRKDPLLPAPVHRYRSVDAPAKEALTDRDIEAARTVTFPDTLRKPLPPEVPLPRPFAPSGAAMLVDPEIEMVDKTASPVLGEGRTPGFAIERGIVIHRLLQELPELALNRRTEFARRYLKRLGMDWNSGDRDAVLTSVLRILGEPEFAPIFAPGSRSEVAIVGHLVVNGAARAVSGKIDRVAVTDSRVFLVDYKTNRAPPRNLAEIPAGYVTQIAIYAALLRQVYPDREVSAGLLFTEAPRMFEIPETVMAGALERLAVS